MKTNNILAFDIGGTKIAYAVVDAKGALVSEIIRHPTPAAPGAVEKLLKTVAARFAGEVDAVAVSTAGTVDRKNARVTGSVGNMPAGYADIDFKTISDKPVVVENDANSAVWAEYVLGNAKGCDNAVLLTLGTGVGVGIIADGRLLTGKSGAADRPPGFEGGGGANPRAGELHRRHAEPAFPGTGPQTARSAQSRPDHASAAESDCGKSPLQ